MRGAPRERITDDGDLPSDKIAFYQRGPQWCRDQATTLGPDVAAVVTELLEVDTLRRPRDYPARGDVWSHTTKRGVPPRATLWR